MKRFLLIGLIGWLFVAQTAALIHVAGHGLVDHYHDGRACDVVCFVQSLHDTDVPSVAAFRPLEFLPVEPAHPIADALAVARRNRAFPPRAPPLSRAFA